MKIIIDSCFLLHTFHFRLNFTACLDNLNQPYELIVPSAVKKELEKLRKKGQKNANLALKIVERFITVIDANCGESSVDDCILFTAKEQDCSVIATTDLELKKRALAEGFSVMYIRNKSRYQLSE